MVGDRNSTRFSQRHYVEIAQVLKAAYVRDFNAGIGWNAVRLGLAHMFSEDNPKFDRQRFLEACLPPDRFKAGER